MRVLIPGHQYALKNLKDAGETILQFYMDPDLHGGNHLVGPSIQEVLRAVINRIQVLDKEKPHPINRYLIQHAREMIALAEVRAILLKVEKGRLRIEELPTGPDGHIQFRP